MRSFFIVSLFCAGVCTGSYAQHINDVIPGSFSAGIHQLAVSNYSRIPELKKWMADNAYQTKMSSTNHVLFRWPMRADASYDLIPNYSITQNYVDQKRDNSNWEDWGCGDRTYDGHDASDISLYPFWWRMQANNNIFACAGAPGIVVEVVDNLNNDFNCLPANQDGNRIVVLHSDSSKTWYYHIKSGSALVRNGQFVEEGKLLCNIASSGSSTNPHLHFGVRDKNNKVIEPFYSNEAEYQCNVLNNDSWWQHQKAYREPQINRVMTHSGTPVLGGPVNNEFYDDFCRTGEQPKAKNQFNPGDMVTIGIALQDSYGADSLFIAVNLPNGEPYFNSRRQVSSHYTSFTGRYNTDYFYLLNQAVVGTYTVTVTYRYAENSPGGLIYKTKTYKHFFTVGCEANRSFGTTTFIGTGGHIVSNSITSRQTLSPSSNMFYQAAGYIQLQPGFKATAGTVFKARIRDCAHID